MTGPKPTPPVTLASVQWDWGDAYNLGYRDDQWTAARRDGRGVLCAATLAGLEAAIQADYRHRPVPRAFDPPSSGTEDEEQTHPPGKEESFLLAALQAAFPAWTISYDPATRAWLARTRKKTICQNSAVLLTATLVLADRCARRQPGGWK